MVANVVESGIGRISVGTHSSAWAGANAINGDMNGKDIISINQFNRADLDMLFAAAGADAAAERDQRQHRPAAR